MTLEEVAAHAEITQVLYRYCRGVDRGDPDLIAACYTPDAIDHHGAWEGLGRDFGAYLVPSMDQSPHVGQHNITNVLIDLRGDAAAWVESYFFALHPQAAEAAVSHIFVVGRYLDRFVRCADKWLIAERHVVIDVSRPLPGGEEWAGAASFLTGGRRGNDPSATLLS